MAKPKGRTTRKVLREINLTPRDFMIMDAALQGTKYSNVGEAFYARLEDGAQVWISKTKLYEVMKRVRLTAEAVRAQATLTERSRRLNVTGAQLVHQPTGAIHARLCYTAATAAKCICGLDALSGPDLP